MWVISVPVVVIVNVSQEPLSWATIVWDNAFSEINRIPFAVVDEVPWSKMAETLNMKFHSLTGRGLTEENLSFLCKWYRLHLRYILKYYIQHLNFRWKSFRWKYNLQPRIINFTISILQRSITIPTVFVLGLVLFIYEIGTWWSSWDLGWRSHCRFH